MAVVVHIEEEFGYRSWIWLAEMSKKELIEWWTAHKTVNAYFYDGPVTFPGEVHRIYHEADYMREMMDADESFTENDKEFFLVEEGEGRTLTQLSEKLTMPDEHWYMHLHTDNDSFLRTAEGEEVYHEGKVSDEEYFSDDYEPCQEAVEESNIAMGKFMKEIIEKEAGKHYGDNSNDRDSEEYN